MEDRGAYLIIGSTDEGSSFEYTQEQAQKVAERLRQKIEIMPIISEGKRIKVTISVGISLVAVGDVDGHDAIERADKKLLEAKSMGKNRVCA